MKDFNKILNLFKQEFAMDWCREFDEFKRVLEYANKNLKPFDKLHFRSGNESLINCLVERLQKKMFECEIIDFNTMEPKQEKDVVLRKIMMFLLANTDSTCKFNLHDDPHINHVVGVCPIMPKFLLVALVWELKLDKYFYELLSYTPAWFGLQFFEVALDSLKYMNEPYVILEKTEYLVRSIFTCISRLDMYKIDEAEKKIIFAKLIDFTMNALRIFYTPDTNKLQHFKKKQLYKYHGYIMKHALQLVTFSFDIYEEVMQPYTDIEMYQNFLKIAMKDDLSIVPNDDIKKQQFRIIVVLLNALETNLESVNLNIFSYWMEIDLTTELTLQQNITSMAWYVAQRMAKNEALSHGVQQKLLSIAVRPKTLNEIVVESNLGEILRALDKDLPYEERKVWFDELIKRTIALGNEECQKVIAQNLKLMTPDNLMKILNYINLILGFKQAKRDKDENINRENRDNSESSDEDEEMAEMDCEELIKIVLLALQQFTDDDIINLIDYEIKLFGDSTTACCGERFEQRSTALLNKYTYPEQFHNLLILFFENPTRMFMKFYGIAIKYCELANQLCSTVKQTVAFSRIYLNKLLIASLNNRNEILDICYPELFAQLYFIMYNDPILKRNILGEIKNACHSMIEKERFESLLAILNILKLIHTHDETRNFKPLNFGYSTVDILLLLAKIMEAARWDLKSYTELRLDVVNDCIHLVGAITKVYLPNLNYDERRNVWKLICEVVKRPLNLYHFHKYSLTPEQSAINFHVFLKSDDRNTYDDENMFILGTYARCTEKEMEWLLRPEDAAQRIDKIIVMFSAPVEKINSSNAYANYRHCLFNYARIKEKYILPTAIGDQTKLEKLTTTLIHVIKSSPPRVYDYIAQTLGYIFINIVKNYMLPMQARTFLNIQSLLKTLPVNSEQEYLLGKLEKLVKEGN